MRRTPHPVLPLLLAAALLAGCTERSGPIGEGGAQTAREEGEGAGGATAAPSSGGTADGTAAIVPVESVTDGDTFRVRFEGESEPVRVIGIDTPEIGPPRGRECFGPAALGAMRRAVQGREVRLVFDAERRDRYDRLLAYVEVAGADVGESLLRGGYAKTLEVPPNTARADRYEEAEREARRATRGLWKDCGG